MPIQSIVCPNGCPPDQLERDYSGGRGSTMNDSGDESNPLNTVYLCNECDWTAIWRIGSGLEELFPGVGRG